MLGMATISILTCHGITMPATQDFTHTNKALADDRDGTLDSHSHPRPFEASSGCKSQTKQN